jgi:hypothetical protein
MVTEQAVESVRNAEGGTQVRFGKPDSKWTSPSFVAKGKGTQKEALRLSGTRQVTSSYVL